MKKLLAVLLVGVLLFVFMPSAFACSTWLPETAWAVGDSGGTLNSLDGIAANKWGWYIDAPGFNTPAIYNVYAGASQNNINNGTLIGRVIICNDGSGYYSADFYPYDWNYTTSIEFGVYDDLKDIAATGGAPGKFTNNVTIQYAKYIVIHFNAMVGQD